MPNSHAANNAQWREAVDAISNDVLAIHPAPFAKTGEITWLRELNRLREELPELSEEQRVVRLMKLVASIGDGHTQIELADNRYASWYLVRLYKFSDGVFITSAHQSLKELTGAEVIEIAGRPVAEVLAAVRELVGADNSFDAKERLHVVHNAYLMRALGFAAEDGALEIRLRLKSGRTVNRTLEPQPVDEENYPYYDEIFSWRYLPEVFGLPFDERSNWVSAYRETPAADFIEADESRPPFLQRRYDFTKRAMPESDAYYLYYGSTNYESMVNQTRQALLEIDAQRPKRVILDIRDNFGGDGSTVEPMVREFIQRQDDPPWSELYLITGRKSFSAALFIIDAFKDHTNISIVGEPAGASFISYGDATQRPYPEIGVNLYVSTLRHQLGASNDLRPFIPVDTPAPFSFSDYENGRDPAIDPILSGADMRSLPLIAMQSGGEATRRAWEERKQRFSSLWWFRPPAEIELRNAVSALNDAERFGDAVEVAALNSEIHPHIWNTWYNLARAQANAGLTEERLSSYKCVVLLEPNNWNVPNILELFAEEGVDPAPPPGCPAAG